MLCCRVVKATSGKHTHDVLKDSEVTMLYLDQRRRVIKRQNICMVYFSDIICFDLMSANEKTVVLNQYAWPELTEFFVCNEIVERMNLEAPHTVMQINNTLLFIL